MALHHALLLAASLALACAESAESLKSLFRHRHQQDNVDEIKRTMMDPHDETGNPCPDVEKPFPCKKSKTCVPMAYVCDDNDDCEDGYDEDPQLCTAAHRPPVEDIMHFLDAEQDWLMPTLFPGKSIGKVAHSLAVSQTVEDFRSKVKMSKNEVRNLKKALAFVASGNEVGMQHLGMPSEAWREVVFFFSKLIKSGFKSG